jgi:hypothetical protein
MVLLGSKQSLYRGGALLVRDRKTKKRNLVSLETHHVKKKLGDFNLNRPCYNLFLADRDAIEIEHQGTRGDARVDRAREK